MSPNEADEFDVDFSDFDFDAEITTEMREADLSQWRDEQDARRRAEDEEVAAARSELDSPSPVTLVSDTIAHSDPETTEPELSLIELPADFDQWTEANQVGWAWPGDEVSLWEVKERRRLYGQWDVARPQPHDGASTATDLTSFDWMANSVTAESWDDDTPPTPPTICRIEGVVGALFGVGRIHRLFGLSGSGKSWVGKMGALEVLLAGGRVLWIDTDSIYSDFRSHMKAMGLSRDVALSGRLYHFHAEGSLRGERFRALLQSDPWDLVVIDGFNAAMTLSGLKGTDDYDVISFYSEVLYVASGTGAAVVLVDHMRKDGETDFGSVYKRNLLTGSDYSVKRMSAFAPGVRGHSAIGLTQKDRQGWATAVHSKRNKTEDQPFAYAIIDSTGDAGVPTVVTIELDEPLDLIVRTTLTQANADADTLRDLLRDNPNGFDSGSDVYKALVARKKSMTNPQITAAAKILVADGEATRTKNRLAIDLRPTTKLLKP